MRTASVVALAAVFCLSTMAQVVPPPIPESLGLPQYEMPEPNGYVEFEAMLAGLPELPLDSEELFLRVFRHKTDAPSEEDLDRCRRLCESQQESQIRLPEILEMEWLYPRRQTPGTLYPELAGTRRLVRVLCVRSVVEERAGDPDQGAETLLDALRIAVKLPRGGALVPWLTGRACEMISHSSVRPLIASGKLSQAALGSMLATMGALEPERVSLREATAFDYDAQGPGALTLDAKEFWELLGGPPNTILPLDDPRADGLMRQFIVDRLPPLVEFDARVAELATQPFFEVSHKVPEVPAGLPDPGEGQTLVFQAVPPKALQKAARFDCDWLGTELMVRLELARLAEGTYPEALTDLDGVTDEDVVDPLSGEPMAYQKIHASYRLYSVSLDGVDNGGTRGDDYGSQFEEGGDYIIWDGPEGE